MNRRIGDRPLRAARSASRALVTGGGGFIGSHLVEHLLARGDRVVVLDDFSTGRRENLVHLSGRAEVEVVQGDVLDVDLVDDLVGRVDTVFHLAAAVGVKRINERPLESLRVNIGGTQNVLEAAAHHGRSVLNVSTSEIYGKNYDVPLSEDHDRVYGAAWKSRWSYAEGKSIGELMAHSLWQQAGLQVVTVRPFNTVGPRQSGRYGMVLPRFVAQALAGEPLTVYGDGTQSRCFCHVADLVPAMASLAGLAEAHGLAVNVGGAEEITIEDLARRVIEVTDSSSVITYVPYDEAYLPGFEEVVRRAPDTSLAHKLVGFEPTVSTDEIIGSVAYALGGWPDRRSA